MQFRSAFLINSGLGAGNIGDDLMARALRNQLPPDFQLHLGVFDNYIHQREPYPAGCTLHTAPPGEIENSWVRDLPGLLIGTGSIFDRPGAGWPLAFLGPRLQHFHDHGLPVDAAGISVEPLVTAEGRRLFDAHCLPIRSWTVRDASSAAALTAMGVDAERVKIGADWGWLYPSTASHSEWARNTWESLGIDLSRPLLGINADRLDVAAIEALHRRDGFQLAFLCTDFRHPGFDRSAAERLQSQISAPSVLVPNEFYSPAELIALLACTTAVLTQRFLLGQAAILAGSVPVFLPSRPSGPDLCEDLGLTPATDVGTAIQTALNNRAQFSEIRAAFTARARHNLDFVALFHGLTR